MTVETLTEEGVGDATRDRIFSAAERLFAQRGFAEVSVRDITADAGVNLAAVNYHFGTKDALLYEIFVTRSTELNRARARMLHEAADRHDGKPPVREILESMITPPTLWNDPAHERYMAHQFLIRARGEGTEAIRELLRTEAKLITRYAETLAAVCPHLSMRDIYWRLHFVLGTIHQNRTLELERLRAVSGGKAGHEPVADIIRRMVDFAEAGFRA